MTAETNAEKAETQPPRPENFDAAFQLPTESYQQFMGRFSSLRMEGSSSASVADELRARGIDPDVVYGNTGRPGIAAPPEDGDGPVALPSTNGVPTTNGVAYTGGSDL